MLLKQSNFDYSVLRHYQEEFLEFAEPVRNVLNGDQMGLGKTYMGVALDSVRRYQADNSPTIKGRKTLVVCPLTGVVDSWVKHFRRLTDLRVVRVDNKSKEARLSLIEKINDDETDVVVVHWQALQPRLGLVEALSKQHWLHIVADEAHRAKNRKAQQTKGLKSIRKVDFKTALTGTPIPNKPYDIWSLLDWLYLGKHQRALVAKSEKDDKVLRSYWNFFNEYVDFYEVNGYYIIKGPKNEADLQRLIRPFYIRRTKDVALPDLPPKQYSELVVDLSPTQRRPYDEMAKDSLAWLGTQGDKPIAAPVVIAQLMRLQQFALASATVADVMTKTGGTTLDHRGQEIPEVALSTKVVALEKPSAKLDALMEWLEDNIKGTDSKVVIFSQFSKMVDLVEKELKEAGYPVGKITGGVPDKMRTRHINNFQDVPVKYEPGEAVKYAPDSGLQIMIGTIGAMKEGIDLYAASDCIFLDRDWSPALNEQAEDRLHRMGQKDTVNIIDIIARNTVDLGRRTTINKKANWIKGMLTGKTQSELLEGED